MPIVIYFPISNKHKPAQEKYMILMRSIFENSIVSREVRIGILAEYFRLSNEESEEIGSFK